MSIFKMDMSPLSSMILDNAVDAESDGRDVARSGNLSIPENTPEESDPKVTVRPSPVMHISEISNRPRKYARFSSILLWGARFGSNIGTLTCTLRDKK